MSDEYNILLPEFCNLLDFEKLLTERLIRSRKQREVRFDFSKLKWIGVLQVSLIYGWVQELISGQINANKCANKWDGSIY